MHDTQVDYLIVGAGPAGLQLAFFLERAGRSYLVLEKADRPGTFFERFPRHRKFLSINKIYTGYADRESQLRYDWNSLLCDDDDFNFTHYSRDYFPDAGDYARYLRDFASRFALKIQFRTRIAEIGREDGVGGAFVVRDTDGRVYRSRALIVATGVSQPYVPDIPGIEHAENYFDFSLDPEEYANQRVLILGKGNSAFETANHLTHVTRVTHLCSPHPVKLAWNTHFFGHLRAINNGFLDTYILKGQNSVLDARVEKIEPVDGELHVSLTFSHAQGQRAVIAYDRVLCCTGFRWDASLFREDCRPELSACGRLPAMTSAWESTNLRDMYFAGTVMQYRDLHKTMSNVLHGFRFNVLSLSRILACRYEGATWPSRRLPLSPEAIADAVIRRVSSNSGLMHQPGFLCDVLAVDERQGAARYHDCLAVDYVRDSEFSRLPRYYVITMEYGQFNGATFDFDREPDPAKAYDDAYLHPRIRCFRGRELVDEHHMSESLENDWRPGEHPGERPLIRQIDFRGQDDPSKYNEGHRGELVKFLARTLAREPVRDQASV